jgi:hypothetical protein
MVDEGPSFWGTTAVGALEATALGVLEPTEALGSVDSVGSVVASDDATGSVVDGVVFSPQPTRPSIPTMLSAQIEPSSRRRPVVRERAVADGSIDANDDASR